MDDFTGTFCNQGKYPILTVVNHYLNPKLKASMPKASLIWNAFKNNSQSSFMHEPTFESSLIVQPMSNPVSSSSFFSSHNVFGLIQNNSKEIVNIILNNFYKLIYFFKVMQVYKFCQCKNGTHKISSSNNDASDKYSFTIDCNIKKVYPNSAMLKENDDSRVKTVTKIINKQKEHEKDDKKNTIWSIFDMNSSAITSPKSSSILTICMFAILVFTIIY